MSAARTDEEIIKSKRNISRFFVEQRHISWVMLIAVCVWGFYSYRSMPQRKDPDTPVKSAVAITVWPGAKGSRSNNWLPERSKRRSPRMPESRRFARFRVAVFPWST